MIKNLGGFFVDEFVRGKYTGLDGRVFDLLFSRKRKDVVVNAKRRSAFARFDDPARAKKVIIDSYSQLGCELVEERGR